MDEQINVTVRVFFPSKGNDDVDVSLSYVSRSHDKVGEMLDVLDRYMREHYPDLGYEVAHWTPPIT